MYIYVPSLRGLVHNITLRSVAILHLTSHLHEASFYY